jgi:hypothetical protein
MADRSFFDGHFFDANHCRCFTVRDWGASEIAAHEHDGNDANAATERFVAMLGKRGRSRYAAPTEFRGIQKRVIAAQIMAEKARLHA